jgi:UDP-3-O-[3-hydroxymyristoyl] glucosamine N-acyltransferase
MTFPDEPGSKHPMLSVEEISALVGGRFEGDGRIRVEGVASLDQASETELGFLAQRRYLRFLPHARARAVLVSEALAGAAAALPARVVVEEPHAVLPRLLAHFYPDRPVSPGIHPTAVLGRGVSLGEGATVGAYAVLEEGARVGNRVRIGAHAVLGVGSVIGDDSVLHPHVVLYPGTRVGARVILHAGVRLGVDGFGYVPREGKAMKIPQVGGCIVEDDVEIGANTCIDRGSIGRTVVGMGSKLDNLVHLAHNVQVGKDVMMAAMVGIAGSSTIGDGAMLGGQAGAVGHIEIGAGARIGAQSGIIGDIPAGETVSGYPARNNREYLRAMGLAFQLPELVKTLRKLEGRLKALEEDTGE